VPAYGTYCYRPFLASVDLLAGEASPQFHTISPSESFSFAVLGDWGQVDSSGVNPHQAKLMQQMAHASVDFGVTTGDNGYPSGNQLNYGDMQQTGADTSVIFGRPFWPVAGSQLPLFASAGNHGLTASSATAHTDLKNWPQDTAVATSGGRYTGDAYCCVNGTSSANYASAWYAFDAGPARLYMLTAAWGDTNPGTANVYANDYAARWTPSSAEYQWLQADLAAHPSGLKLAVFHYPLYSDNNTQPSDTYLQGPSSLEGLLAQYHVNMVFNGHAHIYQRNVPSQAGYPVTYVTGGGGGTLEPIGSCSANDDYGIGWSNSNSRGSACGGATPPTSIEQVYHYLRVLVSGTRVIVWPTDENGNVFDPQTFDFSGVYPDTYIDDAPATGTTATSATFTFNSTLLPATFACTLDGGASTPCTSPFATGALGQGQHTFTVASTFNGLTDPAAATYTWTVDTVAPGPPSGLTAAAPTPYGVNLSWSAGSDNLGVTGYDVLRNGVPVTTTGPVTSFIDQTAAPNTAYQYQVRSRDVAGNVSAYTAPASVTTPATAPAVFADGFESGNLSAWTTKGGLVVQSVDVHTGTYAARGTTTNGGTYAKKTLPGSYTDGYARTYFKIASQTSQINLLRLRDTGGNSIGYLFVDVAGRLSFRNDALSNTTTSDTAVPSPGWHALELHAQENGASSVVEVWLDGYLVADLSTNATTLSSIPIGGLQIGETQTGRTYDVLFDDAAFSTQRVGL
jgi:hypothetical protein